MNIATEERTAGQRAVSRPRGRLSWLRAGDRRVVLILWLALLAESVAFAFLQPVWSRVDEAQHFSYVQYLVENHALPVEGKTFISTDVVQVSRQMNQWGWAPEGQLSTPAMLDPSQWTEVPQGLSDQDREKWVRRNLWYFNYEAMQPPLYYFVNIPVYAATPGGPLNRLLAMRLLAALLASSMVPIAYLTAREAFPDSRLVVIGAAAVALMTQGYALNMSQVSNDILAVPLAAGAILLLLRMLVRGLTWKRSVIAGLVMGAALLSKLTTLFVLPVAFIALALLVAYRREPVRRALQHAVLMFVPVGVVLMPWMIHNIAIYGDATGASAARPLMSSFFASPTVSLSTLRINELLPTYWFGEPVFPFDFWTFAWVAVGVAIVVALIGVCYYIFDRTHWQVGDVHMRIVFMISVLAIGLGLNLVIPFASGIGGVPGRYLYPLLPVFAFLIMFGIDRLLRRERALFMAEVLAGWMIVWECFNFLAYIQNR